MGSQKLNLESKKIWKMHFGNSEYGVDCFGLKIKKSAYRDEDSSFGWDVDHIWPENPDINYDEGSNCIENLQPISIFANDKKSNCMNGKISIHISENQKLEREFAVCKNPFFHTTNFKAIGIMKVHSDPNYDNWEGWIYIYNGFFWIKKNKKWFYAPIELSDNKDGELINTYNSNWNKFDWDFDKFPKR